MTMVFKTLPTTDCRGRSNKQQSINVDSICFPIVIANVVGISISQGVRIHTYAKGRVWSRFRNLEFGKCLPSPPPLIL
jgi:hypothetical protein